MIENSKEIRTAVAKDGRVLPVLEKDYKQLYEQLKSEQQQHQNLKDERYRRQQTAKETADSTGFGGASRCTSFKQKRREENQRRQQELAAATKKHPASPAVKPVAKPAVAAQSTGRSPYYHPNCSCPEPGSPEFDSPKHGLLAPPRVHNLLNGKYID